MRNVFRLQIPDRLSATEKDASPEFWNKKGRSFKSSTDSTAVKNPLKSSTKLVVMPLLQSTTTTTTTTTTTVAPFSSKTLVKSLDRTHSLVKNVELGRSLIESAQLGEEFSQVLNLNTFFMWSYINITLYQ